MEEPEIALAPEQDDDCTEEEGMAEYAAFLEDLEADPVLGPSWRGALTSRGYR